jgi:hypothetical protein
MFTVKRGRTRQAWPPSGRQAGEGAGTRPLWFSPPGGEENRRRVLTRDRVVAEALAIISASGAVALSMRALATASAWYQPR